MSDKQQERLAKLEKKELGRKNAAIKCMAKKKYKLEIYFKFFEKNATNAEKNQLNGQLANM